MNNIFEHVSDATRILREIKLLRLLRHPDIVEIKHIMLPASRREFKDIYVVFELMESDLHQVIKLNNDLTPDHLKPKNILANADCKLKLCDFGLARVSRVRYFVQDYVATRWYRAPELCGSFSSKYTPAIDIWSIGCIFAELVTGKPLFPGKNVVHQLELITDLLGTPPPESVARIRNEKARKYLTGMSKKQSIPFTKYFPGKDPQALRLLERMLAFDPKDRPSAEEALADPYFDGLANLENEPSRQPISKLEFEFERRRLTRDGVRELIYREILEYHPEMLNEYLQGIDQTHFMYPSGVDWCKEQFASLEDDSGESDRNSPVHRKHATSLPRERVCAIDDHDDPKKGCDCSHDEDAKPNSNSATRAATVQTQSPPREQQAADESTPSAKGNVTVSKQMSSSGNSITPTCSIGRSLLKSDSMCASRCIGVVGSDRQVHAR
ncbi:Mitogen-activated protein kinase 9 [Linum perenne]